MSTATALDRFLDPLADCLTPQVAERIVNLELNPELLARIQELAEKANEGTLTPAEDEEYKDYIEGGDVLVADVGKIERLGGLRSCGAADRQRHGQAHEPQSARSAHPIPPQELPSRQPMHCITHRGQGTGAA